MHTMMEGRRVAAEEPVRRPRDIARRISTGKHDRSRPLGGGRALDDCVENRRQTPFLGTLLP